jgi:nitroreductase
MKAVIEAIKARRSVRSYQDKPVPRELIEALIDAGNWAPAQPAHRRVHPAF